MGAPLRRARVWKYRALSTCRRVSGSPKVLQPVLLLGEGSISFGQDVELGWPASSLFWCGYCHIEASTPQSWIELGDGVQLNNNAFLKSEGPGIAIGARALLDSNVEILDSDFHDLRPDRRRGGRPRMGHVSLGEDVFVGDGVKILKGASIGAHSVIGAGSVVTGSIPEGVIAAGSPARVIGELPAPGSPAHVIGEPPAASSPARVIGEPPAAGSPTRAIGEPPAASSSARVIGEPLADTQDIRPRPRSVAMKLDQDA